MTKNIYFQNHYKNIYDVKTCLIVLFNDDFININIFLSNVFNISTHGRMIQGGTITGNHLGKLEGIVDK